MSTVQLQVDDNKLELLLKKLQSLVDEGLVRDISTQNTKSIDISYENAMHRVSKAVQEYKNSPETFTKADGDFFENTKHRLIQRYNDVHS